MQELLDLCGDLETVSFAPGEVLMPEGGRTGCLFFLISGAVAVIKGETPITIIREPGAMFGELSILLDRPHPVTVEATETTVCRVTRGGTEFLKTHPEITVELARLQARRLHEMIGYLADMKKQYGDRKDQLGMVDELLLTLAHRVPKGQGVTR